MPQGKQFDSRRRIAAIVLAAGSSRRMGTSKALLPIDGEAMVCRIVRAFQESGAIDDILVVTGHAPDEVAAALQSFPCRTVWNEAFGSGGMLSSVKVGVSEIGNAEATFVALVDHPRVKPATIAEIVLRFAHGDALLVVPRFQQKRGHPILLSKEACERVLALPPNATMKDMTRDDSRVVELDVDDPAVASDLDTPEEYDREVRKQ